MTTTSSQPLKIAVLISGNGSNLQAIIDHQKQHSSLYEIVLVISNRPNAFGLQRAEQANIATQVIDHKNFTSREAFDAQLQALLDSHQTDLVVLAGFMRILSERFTQHYLGRMLNIHPSLLPKFQGLNTHQRALEAKESEHGLSVHFVTAELDGGPVVVQSKIDIQPNDTVETLQQRIHKLEHQAYPKVIEWFAQGRLSFENEQVIWEQSPLTSPILLDNCE